ncbi:hypothetical protein PRIPAC_72039, partial [Pristionchus pacificus]
SFSPTMLTLLGRSALSSALRLSPIYRTPLVYPVGRDHRTPTLGYRIVARAYSTSDGGDDDVGPIAPIILYTHGIRGSPEQGSHMGIGIFVDDEHEMNKKLPAPWKKDRKVNELDPQLLATCFALMRLEQWPYFLNEDVIVRTQFEPIADQFEKWRNGDDEGSFSLQTVWHLMERFPNVRIEQAEEKDGSMHMATGISIMALEEAESEATKVR